MWHSPRWSMYKAHAGLDVAREYKLYVALAAVVDMWRWSMYRTLAAVFEAREYV